MRDKQDSINADCFHLKADNNSSNRTENIEDYKAIDDKCIEEIPNALQQCIYNHLVSIAKVNNYEISLSSDNEDKNEALSEKNRKSLSKQEPYYFKIIFKKQFKENNKSKEISINLPYSNFYSYEGRAGYSDQLPYVSCPLSFGNNRFKTYFKSWYSLCEFLETHLKN